MWSRPSSDRAAFQDHTSPSIHTSEPELVKVIVSPATSKLPRAAGRLSITADWSNANVPSEANLARRGTERPSILAQMPTRRSIVGGRFNIADLSGSPGLV